MGKRSLPECLKADTENVPDNEQPPAKRYKLRSRNVTVLDNDVSSIKSESKPKKPYITYNKRPFIEYKGKVEYYTEKDDIASACQTLYDWVEKQETDIVPIAFDMEWPFSFQTGPGKSAVIQMCADINVCYVFHISKLMELPSVLLDLLYHKKVRLHGVCIKNDFRKLERDYPTVDAQRMIDQCKDLGVWCNAVEGSSGRWSMERLVMHICKLRINKEGKVRRSKWDVQPLTADQQIYAAIDVYISQVIYLELERREIENEKEVNEFIEQYGEEALNAVDKLK